MASEVIRMFTNQTTAIRPDEEKRAQVMRELYKAGFPMKVGNKKPARGIYSGIVGIRDEKLIVRI